MAKAKTFDTEIVFRDLTRANKKLRHQRKNPDALRRRFTDFVTLSQKLTAVMYKEYPELIGEKWEARAFSGWTPVTELFRKLRNVDQHQSLIRIKMRQTQVYEGTEISADDSGNEVRTPMNFELQVGYSSEVGFNKKMPGQAGVAFIQVGNHQEPVGEPDKVYWYFELEGGTPEIEKAIEVAGTPDVHQLAARCYKVLSEYYKFYRTQLGVEKSTVARCVEKLESLPFTSDHVWKHGDKSALPVGGCIKCGISYKEWIDTFEQRLQELGQVGAAVLKVEGDYVKVDVRL